MNFTITQENLQKLADYLVTRPWSEVNGLIQMIGSLKPVVEAPPAPEALPAPTLQVVPDEK